MRQLVSPVCVLCSSPHPLYLLLPSNAPLLLFFQFFHLYFCWFAFFVDILFVIAVFFGICSTIHRKNSHATSNWYVLGRMWRSLSLHTLCTSNSHVYTLYFESRLNSTRFESVFQISDFGLFLFLVATVPTTLVCAQNKYPFPLILFVNKKDHAYVY